MDQQQHIRNSLISFIELHELWGASPESWHLSWHAGYYNTSHPKCIEEHPQRVHINTVHITVYLQRPIPRVISRPGKVPTTAHSNVKPSTSKPNVRHRTIRSHTFNLRHRGSRYPPQGPTWPRGNYLPDVGVFPLCRQEDYYYCRIRAGIPYIYWRLYHQPRWLSGLRCSHIHSLMIARRSLCPERLGSNPGQGSKGINFSGWHGLDMSIAVTKRR